jgi:hypothetical protein
MSSANYSALKSAESFDFSRIILGKGMLFSRIIHGKLELSANYPGKVEVYRGKSKFHFLKAYHYL